MIKEIAAQTRTMIRPRNRRSLVCRWRLEQLEPRQLLTIIDLAQLAASQGTTIYGAETNDQSAISVSSAGDINGDGFEDLLIGAYKADAFQNARQNAGDSYVIFGGESLPSTIDLGNLGSAGVTIYGADINDLSGISVSGAGDVNGDGFDDLLIGARYADGPENTRSSAGDSYLIFGGPSLPTSINLANLGSAGVTIFGVETTDWSGFALSNGGDINGDGLNDILIGAIQGDAAENAKLSAGDTYVIFGAVSLPATIDLRNPGVAGVTLYGADAGDQSGFFVSSAGDVNGDGFNDLLIGASFADGPGNVRANAGESYLVFGGESLPATIDLGALGSAGVTIFGAEASDRSGVSVSSAGDVNGDGFDDLLIGACYGDASGNARQDAGESYVIFGGASLPATINLANPGASSVTVFGADAGDKSGRCVRNAGDVNGDGFDDMLIGAFAADASGNTKSSAGDSYVIFGRASLPATVDLASPNIPILTIYGVDANDQSGRSLSSAGDVNGDGFGDLLIGAITGDSLLNGKESAGDSYVIFGGDFTASITHQGTGTGETLTGTTSANSIIGGRGNDILIGSGGPDVLTGGQGNDILAVSDLTFMRLVGGRGTDRVRLDGAGLSLDLTTLKDNRLHGIEQIDITGSGRNTLTLNLREVLNLSDESNSLVVFRNYGDTVNIGLGWTQGTDETIGGSVFSLYTQGNAILKVQNAVEINHAPTFTSGTTGSVPEQVATSTVIYTAVATDADEFSPNNVVTYSIKPTAADAAYVTVNPLSGAVTLLESANLGTKSSYVFTVVATDGGTPALFAEQSVTVAVLTNTAPTSISLSNTVASVAENTSTGSRIRIADISVTDDGLGTNTLFVSGTNAASFEISGASLYLKAGIVLDYESLSSYSITINVDDSTLGASPDASVNTTLRLTDVNEAPVSMSLSNRSVSENSAANTVIGTLSAADADAGQTFVFSLPAGIADNNLFNIDGSRLGAGRTFDYETRSSYSVLVRVTDQGGLTFDSAITIDITDVVDETAPVSRITALPSTLYSLSFTVSATGTDSGTGATGIAQYELYWSSDGNYVKFATVSGATASATFTGEANTTYWFLSIARDFGGNVEAKIVGDTCTRIADIVPPSSQVTAASSNTAGLFSLQLTGCKVSGTAMTQFDVYVSLDGAAPVLLGSTSAVAGTSGQYSGLITYQALADGNSHTYRFYSRGRDGIGNVEAAPASGDITLTETFSAPALITAAKIDVQLGASQRSYVRYLDVFFSADATTLLTGNRIAVERFAIGASSVTAGTGTTVAVSGMSGSANRLQLDFGASGLGGLREAGNGFYRVRLDLNQDGDFTDSVDQAFEFYRLFGDVNGDAVVDVMDTNFVTGQMGRSGSGLDGDVDGNGTVNATDRLYTTQQRGKKLLAALLGWLDD